MEVPAGNVDESDQKRGGKCCKTDAAVALLINAIQKLTCFVLLRILGGCCCDYRRAVIVTRFISFAPHLIICVGSAISAEGSSYQLDSGFDDDQFNDQWDNVKLSYVQDLVVAVVSAVVIIFTIVGLVGAIKYDAIMIGSNVFFTIVGMAVFIWEIAMDDYSSTGWKAYYIVSILILELLFIYPCLMLIHEIKTGTMSAATYPLHEVYCCCFKGETSEQICCNTAKIVGWTLLGIAVAVGAWILLGYAAIMNMCC